MSFPVKWTMASGSALLFLLVLGALSYCRLDEEAPAQQGFRRRISSWKNWTPRWQILWLVAATDITEKKRVEDALRESEERLRMRVSNVKDYSLTTLDPERRITSRNGAAQRIQEYQAEVVGRHVSIFYRPGEAAIGKATIELETAIKAGCFEDDGWRGRKDGSQFWANAIVTPLQDLSGGVRGFLKITRDTTEKRKAEQELLRRSAELETATKNWNRFHIRCRTSCECHCMALTASVWHRDSKRSVSSACTG